MATPSINKALERREMNRLVGDYVKLDAEIKAKEKIRAKWRGQIETYMYGNNLMQMKVKQGIIEILEQNKAIISARYTSYEYSDLLKIVTPTIADKCLVQRVDRDIVEELVKKRMIPKAIEDHKNVLLTDIFSVKCLVPVDITVPGSLSNEGRHINGDDEGMAVD